jgi:hypothetical protein
MTSSDLTAIYCEDYKRNIKISICGKTWTFLNVRPGGAFSGTERTTGTSGVKTLSRKITRFFVLTCLVVKPKLKWELGHFYIDIFVNCN